MTPSPDRGLSQSAAAPNRRDGHKHGAGFRASGCVRVPVRRCLGGAKLLRVETTRAAEQTDRGLSQSAAAPNRRDGYKHGTGSRASECVRVPVRRCLGGAKLLRVETTRGPGNGARIVPIRSGLEPAGRPQARGRLPCVGVRPGFSSPVPWRSEAAASWTTRGPEQTDRGLSQSAAASNRRDGHKHGAGSRASGCVRVPVRRCLGGAKLLRVETTRAAEQTDRGLSQSAAAPNRRDGHKHGTGSRASECVRVSVRRCLGRCGAAASWDNSRSGTAERGLSQSAAASNRRDGHKHGTGSRASECVRVPVRRCLGGAVLLRVGTTRGPEQRSADCPNPQRPRTGGTATSTGQAPVGRSASEFQFAGGLGVRSCCELGQLAVRCNGARIVPIRSGLNACNL